MLLDEHSAGGEIEHDEDIEKKMTAFFDMAQKTLAQIRKILREEVIVPTLGKTVYALPENFYSLYRIWADGKNATRRFRWMGREARHSGGVRGGDGRIFRHAADDPDRTRRTATNLRSRRTPASACRTMWRRSSSSPIS